MSPTDALAKLLRELEPGEQLKIEPSIGSDRQLVISMFKRSLDPATPFEPKRSITRVVSHAELTMSRFPDAELLDLVRAMRAELLEARQESHR